VGIKDLYETAGIPTTSSSAVRADYVPAQDCAVVEKLTAAGTVMVRKTHTHEFAYGAVTPTTRNPWDLGRLQRWLRCRGRGGRVHGRHGQRHRRLDPDPRIHVTGLPSLSVPCGFTEGGLPIGMQIMGRPFAEPTLLTVGQAYESATAWLGRRPSL
jgi:Asp-tRNA(Asn)/Glu-tRNA(Gln) amidotransferase A subunit family amidase